MLLLFLISMSIFESQHALQGYENFVGTQATTDRMTYEVTDWSSHLAYLDTFDAQGTSIRYLDRGDRNGDVIVLLHGTPTNSWLWRKIVPGLLADGYRVIVPDMI